MNCRDNQIHKLRDEYFALHDKALELYRTDDEPDVRVIQEREAEIIGTLRRLGAGLYGSAS